MLVLALNFISSTWTSLASFRPCYLCSQVQNRSLQNIEHRSCCPLLGYGDQITPKEANSVWSNCISIHNFTHCIYTLVGLCVGLGELCSKTVLLCYAPMLSNALIMLLRIVIMLTLCSLIIFLSRWHRLSKHGRLL